MKLQIVNKSGDIIRLKPQIRYKSFRKWYYIKCGAYEGHIKALNETAALFKFCLRHPLILFEIEDL